MPSTKISTKGPVIIFGRGWGRREMIFPQKFSLPNMQPIIDFLTRHQIFSNAFLPDRFICMLIAILKCMLK